MLFPDKSCSFQLDMTVFSVPAGWHLQHTNADATWFFDDPEDLKRRVRHCLLEALVPKYNAALARIPRKYEPQAEAYPSFFAYTHMYPFNYHAKADFVLMVDLNATIEPYMLGPFNVSHYLAWHVIANGEESLPLSTNKLLPYLNYKVNLLCDATIALISN